MTSNERVRLRRVCVQLREVAATVEPVTTRDKLEALIDLLQVEPKRQYGYKIGERALSVIMDWLETDPQERSTVKALAEQLGVKRQTIYCHLARIRNYD